MGKLRCGACVVIAVIAATVAAGLQARPAAAADVTSPPADQSQDTTSTTSGSPPSESAPDQVGAAVTAATTTAVDTAVQIATDVGNDVASSASGIAGPAPAIASSASAAAADTVDGATPEVAPTQSVDGPASPDSAGTVAPEPTSSSLNEPAADQGDPRVQPAIPTGTVAPSLDGPSAAPASVPAAAAPRLTKPTAPAQPVKTHVERPPSQPSAAESVAAPAVPAPQAQVGGSAGGTVPTRTTPIPSRNSADTTAGTAQRAPPRLLSPLVSLAHGSKVVAKLLPRHLPNASLGQGLDGEGALITRIAKLLAVVYAGFLIVWFWATRVRWNGR